jgi:hypothetical protein
VVELSGHEEHTDDATSLLKVSSGQTSHEVLPSELVSPRLHCLQAPLTENVPASHFTQLPIVPS